MTDTPESLRVTMERASETIDSYANEAKQYRAEADSLRAELAAARKALAIAEDINGGLADGYKARAEAAEKERDDLKRVLESVASEEHRTKKLLRTLLDAVMETTKFSDRAPELVRAMTEAYGIAGAAVPPRPEQKEPRDG